MNGPRVRRSWFAALAVGALAVISPGGASAAFSTDPEPTTFGTLTPLFGPERCVTNRVVDYEPSCQVGTTIGRHLVLSPDDRFAYVAEFQFFPEPSRPTGATLAVYRRNGRNGTLRPLYGRGACLATAIAETVDERFGCGRWASGPPGGLAISPDGRNLYMTFFSHSGTESEDAGVMIVERDQTTGTLRIVGCLSAKGRNGCERVPRLAGVPGPVAVSGDGSSVYVGVGELTEGSLSSPAKILSFRRDFRQAGSLTTPAGDSACASEPGVTGCRPTRGIPEGPIGLAVSPAGGSVYVAGNDRNSGGDYTPLGTLTAFARNPATGALTQLPGAAGCHTAIAKEGCTVEAFAGAAGSGWEAPTITRDGRNAYVGFNNGYAGDGGIIVFARRRADGVLRRLPRQRGCVSTDGRYGCTVAPAASNVLSTAVSSGGRTVYAAGFDAMVALSRGRRDGALTPLRGARSCLGRPRRCTRPSEYIQVQGQSLALTADATYLYAAGGNIGIYARNAPQIRVGRLPRRSAGLQRKVKIRIWAKPRLRRLTVLLDGRTIRRTRRRRLRLSLPADRRRHRLQLQAVDTLGRKNRRTVRFGPTRRR